MLVGLGIRAVEQGFSVQYFRVDELLTALKADAALPPARLKRRKYMSTALLLIDELGFDPMNRQEASLFFRLVSYRYGRGAIMITTNKSVRDWTELRKRCSAALRFGLDVQTCGFLTEHQGMSSSMRACGHPLTSRASNLAR